jgi:hypothetical protein
MKKAIVLSILSLSLGLSACDFLDTEPKGIAIPTTTEDYGNLMKDVSLSTTINEFPTYSCDDVVFPADLSETTSNVYFWKENFFRLEESDENWNDIYSHIYTVNVVIQNVMSSTEGTSADKQRVLAEAKLFRAYYFWILQSLYGPAYDVKTASTDLSVPLPLEPNLEALLPRSTVEEVTNNILSDLNGIAQYLPITGSNPYKPNRASAHAMSARVFFYMGRYDEAAAEADSALKYNSELNDMRTWEINDPQKPSSITNRPTDLQSPEKIWYLSTSISGGLRNWALSDEMKQLYNPKDLRFQLWFTTLTSRGEYYYNDSTYCFLVDRSNLSLTVPEMMLIKAEALARNNNTQALDILNNLRKYRFSETDYQPIVQESGQSLLSLVLDERRRELVLSGLRWFDMKRLAKEGVYTTTLTRTEADGTVHTLEPNSGKYLFPISPYVLSMNPNIVQNPR